MKRKAFIAFSAVWLTTASIQFPVMAQRGRVSGSTPTAPPQAEVNPNLEAAARDMSDKAQDAWNIASNQREQVSVELYVALAGFAGGSRAFWQMVADAREDNSLRSAARRVVAAAREIDGMFGSAGIPSLLEPWRLVQQHVARTSDIYSLGYSARGGYRETGRRGSTPGTTPIPPGGSFRWRGRVDGTDYILVQGSQVSIRHIEYNAIRDASYDLPAPLPQQSLQLRLTKLRGRGNVAIVRQPAPDNNYTLTLLVEDPAGGDDFYEFEVTW